MTDESPDVPTGPDRPNAGAAERRQRQLPLLVRAAHPRLALLFGIGTALAASLTGLDLGPSMLAGLAVFVAQLIAGLLNDVYDAPLDRAAERTGKPIADGRVPRGNATFTATALLIVVVPLSLQTGLGAGGYLLAAVVVAFLHNRALHRTPLSFVGWMVTLPLIATFISYADRGDASGSAPTIAMLLSAAAAGLCLHLITSLRDLPADHRAGIRPLPLVIALRTGAPQLMWATIALTLLTGVAFIIVALGPGLQR